MAAMIYVYCSSGRDKRREQGGRGMEGGKQEGQRGRKAGKEEWKRKGKTKNKNIIASTNLLNLLPNGCKRSTNVFSVACDCYQPESEGGREEGGRREGEKEGGKEGEMDGWMEG